MKGLFKAGFLIPASIGVFAAAVSMFAPATVHADAAPGRAASERVLAQFFEECRFGFYNTYQNWTYNDGPAGRRLRAARVAVQQDRPVEPLLQRIKDFGRPYRITNAIEEANAVYLEASFVQSDRQAVDGVTTYTMYIIGFMMYADEATDKWVLFSYAPMGTQVLNESMAREFGFIS